jgi:hypothetical protein
MTALNYTCPHCGMVSHNLNDVRERYCGFCHRWADGDRGKAIYSEPTPGQRVTELHCWIATYADGSEGIIAANAGELGMTPLLSSRRATAERMATLADNAMRTVAQQTGHKTSIRLVTFRSTEGGGKA